MLFLDSQLHIIADEILFEGSLSSASVYPRELIKRVLFYNASAVIIAHNHPSGMAEPSQSDIELTYKIGQVLDMIEVKLLDHFIIGEGQTTSLARLGYI